MALYSITYCPKVFVASVALSDQSKSAQIIKEANEYLGTSFVIATSDDPEWTIYKYDPLSLNITVEDESIASQFEKMLEKDNYLSLVVQEPAFSLQVASSQNVQLSTKFTNFMSSYSKLLTGLSPTVVLYGSDGGTGEFIARKVHAELEKRRIQATCQSCDEFQFDKITEQQTIIFIVSTSGQGKFPLNAKQFWTNLSQLPDDISLGNMRYSVFGLGDSQFWKPPLGKLYYCKPARDLDKKLVSMGAVQLLPICCGDDQDVGGPEEALQTWLPLLCTSIGATSETKPPSPLQNGERNADPTNTKDDKVDKKRELTKLIRDKGMEMGLSAIAFAKLEKSECGPAYEEWVAKGFHGEMGYLSREDAVQKRKNPTLLSPGTVSAIVATLNYDPKLDPEPYTDPSAAIFARYAQGEDYHEILKPKLMKLQQWIQTLPEVQSKSGRVYVDTGPILERELARKAGLGWFGKNTMMIMPKKGSYFFIGVLLIDIELEYDKPFEQDKCGGCSACLPACPTGALIGKNPETGAPMMDARRCISYLTIEQKGPIPLQFRKLIGNRIYGCDICQEACPWNQYSTMTTEPAFIPPDNKIKLHGEKLVDLLSLTQADFSKKFKGSAIKRTKRRGLLRNVAVALGNWKNPSAIPALINALGDEDALVRGHVAWALGEIGGEDALRVLRDKLESEIDNYVRDEIIQALDQKQRM